MSDLEKYLLESGDGPFSKWYVPDLHAASGAVLVFVFESPHVAEVCQKVPVVGSAGRSALRNLLLDPQADLSLGEYAAGDNGRIAILNVCNVPLQQAAFAESDSSPELTSDDWSTLKEVRRAPSRTVEAMLEGEAKRAVQLLAERLAKPLDALNESDL